MESQVVSWIFDQGSIVVAFVLGTGFGYMFTKKVMGDQVARLVKEVSELKKEHELSDERCEREIRELRKRITTLEDSRAFILQNTLKSKN